MDKTGLIAEIDETMRKLSNQLALLTDLQQPGTTGSDYVKNVEWHLQSARSLFGFYKEEVKRIHKATQKILKGKGKS